MEEEIKQFRDGIFALRTNFGELAQLMLKKSEGFTSADNNTYDLKGLNGEKIEVKFSRAYKDIKLTEDNAISLCCNSSISVYRSDEAEHKDANYDCNIQQLKPEFFDVLYYGVFFSDKIEVFRAERAYFPESIEAFMADKESARERFPGYASQHKNGTECQFHITKRTHKHHYDNYFLKEISYEELYDLLRQ